MHSREDDTDCVIEGDHVVVYGGQEFCILAPACLEGFFRILAEATRRAGPMDDACARASREYGTTWSD